MIMPRLFHSQYLSLSPIWLAYEQKKIKSQGLSMNSKLLSAYAMVEHKSLSPNLLEKLNHTIDIGMQSLPSIYLARAFLGNKLTDLPDNIDHYQYIKSVSEWANESNTQKKPYRVTNILKQLQMKRTDDDLDLIMAALLEHSLDSMEKLANLSPLAWTKTAYTLLQDQLFKLLMIKSGCTNILQLKKCLEFLSTYPNSDTQNPSTKLLTSINQLLSDEMYKAIEKHKHKPINTIIKNFAQINLSISQQMCGKDYLDLLVRQYCIYLNWLTVRVLMSQSSQHFIINFQQFLSLLLIQFQNLSQNSINEVKYPEIPILKVQILELMITTIRKARPQNISLISQNYNYKRNTKGKGKNLLQDLLILNKRYENICQNLSQLKYFDILTFSIVYRITDGIISDLNIKAVKKLLSELMEKPIIILSKEQIEAATLLSSYFGIHQHYNHFIKFSNTKGISSEAKTDNEQDANIYKHILNPAFSERKVFHKEINDGIFIKSTKMGGTKSEKGQMRIRKFFNG